MFSVFSMFSMFSMFSKLIPCFPRWGWQDSTTCGNLQNSGMNVQWVISYISLPSSLVFCFIDSRHFYKALQATPNFNGEIGLHTKFYFKKLNTEVFLNLLFAFFMFCQEVWQIRVILFIHFRTPQVTELQNFLGYMWESASIINPCKFHEFHITRKKMTGRSLGQNRPLIRPDICHFFSTNVLLGLIFLHIKTRKFGKKMHIWRCFLHHTHMPYVENFRFQMETSEIS